MNPRARSTLLVVLSALATGCVDVDAPTGIAAPRSLTLAAAPQFAITPSAAVIEALDRGRLTLVETSSDSVLASSDTPLDPNQSEWVFEFTLQLLEDQELDVRLDVELIDSDPGFDAVEFAGRTQFQIQASFEALEIRQINLGRGPLENLSLSELRVSGARSRIQEGGSDALSVDTLGAAPGQIIFFESTDPLVASVDSAGNIAALTPGTTLIIASAGRVADTVSLTVGEVDLPSAQEIESRLVPQADYVTGAFFLRSLSDDAAASEISEAIGLLVSDMLADRGPEAVGHWETAEELWEAYGRGTDLRFFEGPQLSVIELTLMHAADALGIDFR